MNLITNFEITLDKSAEIAEWQRTHLIERHKANVPASSILGTEVQKVLRQHEWQYVFPTSSPLVTRTAECRCPICYDKALDSYYHSGFASSLSSFVQRYDAKISWTDGGEDDE